MKLAMLLAATTLTAATVSAQTAAPAPMRPIPERTVRYDFSNPDLIPADWTLEIHPDGSGHFRSRRGSAPRQTGDQSVSIWIEPPDQDREIHVSAPFAARLFQIAAEEHFFRKSCESHAKVAFTGTKRLSYAGPETKPDTGPEIAADEAVPCTFNYTTDKTIEALSDQLQAVSATLIEAARIERLRQHDKLGLDQEMQTFAEMASDGRAAELGAIRDELVSLANDEALMERVRKRARELLAKAGE